MASSPPYEDGNGKAYLPRKSSKVTKPTLSRTSKRTSLSHEHSLTSDGRHKRVWKACERCRMKKTKCDGESPCKRCKDDGLLCQAGTRRKTEYKQAPKGYAEVLETSQFALTSTVQRLYRMIKNGESWDLGEPDTNERGEPVIHDIVDKLGLLRQPSDLPITFAETETELVEVRRSLEEQESQQSPAPSFVNTAELMDALKKDNFTLNERKHSLDCITSTPPLKSERASSVESDASLQLPSYMSANAASPYEVAQPNTYNSNPSPRLQAPQPRFPPSSMTQLRANSYVSDQSTSISTPSPLIDTFDSPMLFSDSTPFNAWTSNEWLSDSHPLSRTAKIFQKSNPLGVQMSNLPQFPGYATQDFAPGMQSTREGVWQGDGTIRPSDMMNFHTSQQSSMY